MEKQYYYYGGGAAIVIVLFLLYRRKQKIIAAAQESEESTDAMNFGNTGLSYSPISSGGGSNTTAAAEIPLPELSSSNAAKTPSILDLISGVGANDILGIIAKNLSGGGTATVDSTNKGVTTVTVNTPTPAPTPKPVGTNITTYLPDPIPLPAPAPEPQFPVYPTQPIPTAAPPAPAPVAAPAYIAAGYVNTSFGAAYVPPNTYTTQAEVENLGRIYAEANAGGGA